MIVNNYKFWEIYIFLGMYFTIKIYFLNCQYTNYLHKVKIDITCIMYI